MAATVLVGFADALAAIETSYDLVDAGYAVVAFAREGSSPPLAHASMVRVVSIPDPRAGSQRAIDGLVALWSSLGADVVMPLDDEAVWLVDAARNIPGLSRAIVIAGPTGNQARLALDKSVQIELAERVGLQVPCTVVATALSDVDATSSALPRLPVLVKSAAAVDVRGLVLSRAAGAECRTVSDVAVAVSRLHGGPALIQTMVSGIGEGLFGLATDSGVLAWSAHRRVRMMNPAGSGSSACESIAVDPELRAVAEKFVLEAGWRGIFMLEFLRDGDGVPWFMEINGRAWGSMALARARGLHYPAWAVALSLDSQFRPDELRDLPHRRSRHLGREIVHLMFVAKRGPSSIPRLASTCFQMAMWRRTDRLYNWRRGEARVFFEDSWATVKTRLPISRRRARPRAGVAGS